MQTDTHLFSSSSPTFPLERQQTDKSGTGQIMQERWMEGEGEKDGREEAERQREGKEREKEEFSDTTSSPLPPPLPLRCRERSLVGLSHQSNWERHPEQRAAAGGARPCETFAAANLGGLVKANAVPVAWLPTSVDDDAK